jgi:GNAT superfamily N-acetyltransferase
MWRASVDAPLRNGQTLRVRNLAGVKIVDFSSERQAEVRGLILDGLGERWGTVDESLNPDLDDIASSYGAGRVLVVLDEDRVVGTGAIMPRSLLIAEVLRMSVARSHRRRGVARLLVASLLDVARAWSVERVICETATEWTSAKQLYLSCGFRLTHEVDGEFCRDSYFEYDIA